MATLTATAKAQFDCGCVASRRNAIGRACAVIRMGLLAAGGVELTHPDGAVDRPCVRASTLICRFVPVTRRPKNHAWHLQVANGTFPSRNLCTYYCNLNRR